jgi:hypothetical protein
MLNIEVSTNSRKIPTFELPTGTKYTCKFEKDGSISSVKKGSKVITGTDLGDFVVGINDVDVPVYEDTDKKIYAFNSMSFVDSKGNSVIFDFNDDHYLVKYQDTKKGMTTYFIPKRNNEKYNESVLTKIKYAIENFPIGVAMAVPVNFDGEVEYALEIINGKVFSIDFIKN